MVINTQSSQITETFTELSCLPLVQPYALRDGRQFCFFQATALRWARMYSIYLALFQFHAFIEQVRI